MVDLTTLTIAEASRLMLDHELSPVELTQAALAQIEPTGGVDEQALQLRDAMRVLFPEAVALVSTARQGFMRE